MRALVTGGGGFAGSWLCRRLADQGHDVLSPSVDVTDRLEVGQMLEDAQPRWVFHLAAVSDPRSAARDSARAHEVNVEGTRNVLRASASLRRPPQVLFTSSSAVYAECGSPLTEDSPVSSGHSYVDSKLAAEAVCRVFSGDLRIAVVRPFNHTGPGQAPIRVVPALAAKVSESARTGKPVRAGRLDVRRDLTDVRDTVAAYIALMEAEAEGLFNVCSGIPTRLLDLAEELARLAGIDEPQFEFDPNLVRPDEPAVIVGDNSKLRQATGWAPRIPLSQTLADVLAELQF
jgi:GDP-4-dehydro-6-deoxy-D-mannose reductase